jgi:hypothetical protein
VVCFEPACLKGFASRADSASISSPPPASTGRGYSPKRDRASGPPGRDAAHNKLSRVLDEGEEREHALRLLEEKYPQYRTEPPDGPVLVVDVTEVRDWSA